MDETINELKHKVEKLEDTEIKGIKEDIGKIKVELATNNVLTQQCVVSNEKLGNTMDAIKDTMIELSQSVKNSNSSIGEINCRLDKLDDKVENKFKSFNDKMGEIDSKSKFDIMVWIKDNFIGCAIVIASIIYFISQII